MHQLLGRQIRDAADPDGELNLQKLLDIVSGSYTQVDEERRGVVRSMQLMSAEALALTQELADSTAAQLQAILDHVKDVIITVDETGGVTSINATGRRVFGHDEAEIVGRPVSFLLPQLAAQDGLAAELERLAARLEDTQGDLAAHETCGRHSSGTPFSAEIAVSKTRIQQRTVYVVCLRDTTDRKRAELLAAGERRVFERLAANVDLRITLEAITEVVEGAAPDSFCTLRLLNEESNQLTLCAGPRMPSEYLHAMETVPIDARNGSCAAAVYLQRQVIVTDIARDALWEQRRDAAIAAGLHACWSTPIQASDGRVLGTLALYFSRPRSPRRYDHELMSRMTQLAGIAIQRRLAESALQVSEQRYRRLFDTVFEEKEKAQVTLQSIGDAVITTDAEGCVEYLNMVAEHLTGWQSSEVIGKPLSDAFSILNEATRTPVENPASRALRDGQAIAVADQALLVNRRGQEIAIRDSAAPIRDRAGNTIGAVMVFHDVSKEFRLRRALAYQASHDALTGLINRREFEKRLNEALLMARSDPRVTHALLYLDLDQFKVVNDTCGHQAGDRLLKQITCVLQTRLRANDTIARLGGDEFGVLLRDCTLGGAEKIADNLRQAVRDYRFEWQDGAINIGVSMGIVEMNGCSESISSVMSAADVACYAAKDSGRNRVHTYQHGAAPERHREMQWVSRLTRACEENRFELYYQPIVPIGAKRDARSHFELLLRLRGEQGEMIHPGEFIPAAERYNIMPMIDRWVVAQALGSLAHYRTDGDSRTGYTLSINLSGTSLNDDRFLEFLIVELQTYDLSPGAVCFEITETAAISNLANVVQFMNQFRSHGCQFSLDDFGSGLSSFRYLKNLPVDYLKIDGQFIQNVTTDHVDRRMVAAITQIGHAMGIKTIAERVETAEVMNCLVDLGLEYAQGIYFAAPMPVESLSRVTRTGPQLKLVNTA